jgi:lipid II:glycine glycyltransferase (peptidoglycan interpeptide bridge formation enzyme)
MQFHLGATNDACLYYSPSKLMMDEAVNYASAMQLRYLHMGGGLGGSVADGLFRFKKGFGKKYHAFSTLRFVHNNSLYQQLKNTEGARLQYIDPSFFPAYRIT